MNNNLTLHKNMNSKNIFIVAFITISIVVGIVYFFGVSRNKYEGINNGQEVVIYKEKNCGCCDVYAKYLKNKGYDVSIANKTDSRLEKIKKDFGVPHELESCHTAKIGDYIVEGHVSEEAIAKMLKKKPRITGIALAGMPAGSPGMSGKKEGMFNIFSFMKDGTYKLFISL